VGSGLAFGTSRTALRVNPSRLSVNDHGLFYGGRRASETVRRYKNVSLYLGAGEDRKLHAGTKLGGGGFVGGGWED
jgi:hypothetical protein